MTGRAAEAQNVADARPPKILPGEEGVWVLVLGDMIVFGLFFVTYLYYRAQEADLFDRSQARLNLYFGVINTLLLLTSSWFVVMGVQAVRDECRARAKTLLRLACLCGAGFCAIKAIEYTEAFDQGVTLVTNDFFMFYFMYTGIHLLHVVIGLAVLLFLMRSANESKPHDVRIFESGATFWHMVDLLWIMLFPLLYLVK
jgi:nitric oxide reductase NorE protein